MITPDMSYGKTVNDGVNEYKEVLSSTGQVVGYQEVKKETPKQPSSSNENNGGALILSLLLATMAVGGIWFVFFK